MTKINKLFIETPKGGGCGDTMIEGKLLGKDIIIYEEGGHDRAQAEFIVLACNSHDDLVAACTEAEKAISQAVEVMEIAGFEAPEGSVLDILRKALIKAQVVKS